MFETANINTASISEATSAEIVPPTLLAQESEKRDGQLLVPRIEDFPTKARVKVVDAHARGVPLFQKCNRQLDTTITFVDILEKTTQEGQARFKAAETTSPEAERQADEKLAKVKAEFATLQKIHQRLAGKQDARALLLAPSPLTGTNHLLDDQRTTLAAHKGLGDVLAEHVPFLQSRDRQSQRDNLLQTQAKALTRRCDAFAFEVFSPLRLKVELETPNLPNLEELVGRSQEQVECTATESASKLWESAADWSARLSEAQAYQDKLYGWLDKETDEVKKLGLEWRVNSCKTQYSNTLQINREGLEKQVGFVHGLLISKVLEDATTMVVPTMKAIRQSYQPYELGDASTFMLDTWIPYEAVEEAQKINTKAELLLQLSRHYPASNLGGLESTLSKTTRGMEGYGSDAAKENEEFTKDRKLFWHVAPYDVIKTILTRGFLSSRQAQIDRFGESYLHSGGGIKTTKDQVITADEYGYEKTVDKSQFKYNSALGRVKNPNQEMHQVCFQVDSPYHYQDGVALVFSKASLCSKSQFFDEDGWHLFSQDYRDNEDSPGFETDLGKEPNMLIVVTDARSGDFIKFLKDNLGKTDDWIAQNVIQVQARENGTMDIDAEQIRQRFFERHQITIQRGMFVPTGENAQHAGGHDLLYTYKAA